jgi:hypothetical protein
MKSSEEQEPKMKNIATREREERKRERERERTRGEEVLKE